MRKVYKLLIDEGIVTDSTMIYYDNYPILMIYNYRMLNDCEFDSEYCLYLTVDRENAIIGVDEII